MMQMISMKDMSKTLEEVQKELTPSVAPSAEYINEYPYGLCLCLDEDSITKLQIENMPEVGDGIMLMAVAKVTSVSMNETAAGARRRIELQITHLELEEGDGADDEVAEGE